MCANVSTGGDTEEMKYLIDELTERVENITKYVVLWVRKSQVIPCN